MPGRDGTAQRLGGSALWAGFPGQGPIVKALSAQLGVLAGSGDLGLRLHHPTQVGLPPMLLAPGIELGDLALRPSSQPLRCLLCFTDQRGPDSGHREPQEHLHGFQQAASGSQVSVGGPRRSQRQEPLSGCCQVRAAVGLGWVLEQQGRGRVGELEGCSRGSSASPPALSPGRSRRASTS